MDKKNDIFLNVIDNHKGIIYKIANSYCREQEVREDLVQEIIIQLWQSFDSYNDQFKYSTWVYRIALNTAISYYRKALSLEIPRWAEKEKIISNMAKCKRL